MTNEKHWDNLAEEFEIKVGNPINDDRNGRILSAIKACGNKTGTAIDFGCGVGHALPALSAAFQSVIALDISYACLQRARKDHPGQNITFLHKDLSRPIKRFPKADLAFCCNVAISADLKMNEAIIENVLRAVDKNGHALFVLPSIESAYLSAIRMYNWYQRERTDLNDIAKSEFDDFTSKKALPHLGILYRAGVPTKHYLKEEIEMLLQRKTIQLESLSKVEYNWNTELNAPPKWMKEPYPWDWLVHCRKL